MTTANRLQKGNGVNCVSTTVLLTAILGVPGLAQGKMSQAEEPDILGLVSIGSGYFPIPEGVQQLSVPNAGFEEQANGRPAAWTAIGFDVAETGAPEGQAFLQTPGGNRVMLSIDNLDVEPGQPHLLSCWLKSTESFSGGLSLAQADTTYGRHIALSFPATNGEWKRVGCYFRNLPGGRGGRLWIRRSPTDPVPPFAIDDVRLRTATDTEFSRGWDGWRSRYPARDLSPRPTDGRNLALTVSKLQGGSTPRRSLLVWAIGSSYTNMLGNGETLRQQIQKKFPNAPDIVYKKHVGSAVPWQYVLGWARHIVVPEQPDLVLIYTLGKPEDLDLLLTELRTNTTADIIVPSIHWRIRDRKNWGVSEDAVDQKVADLRDVCRKHGAEFVENRKEWAEYLSAHNMDVEIDAEKGLLKDAVHQSDYGALVINENIARHINAPGSFAYAPEERERRLLVQSPRSIRETESVTILGQHQTAIAGTSVVLSGAAAKIRVCFQGNRIDLVGVRGTDAGSVQVIIDGKPASDANTFYPTYIHCGPQNAKPERGSSADQCPHGVELGTNIVPQRWTITMLDDEGNYDLVGSQTGQDGKGHNLASFTSSSGQITIPPELWRRALKRGRTREYTNKAGDTFTFDVLRCAAAAVDFRGTDGQQFTQRLVENLTNTQHVLELRANGDGPVTVVAFDVFEPPVHQDMPSAERHPVR